MSFSFFPSSARNKKSSCKQKFLSRKMKFLPNFSNQLSSVACFLFLGTISTRSTATLVDAKSMLLPPDEKTKTRFDQENPTTMVPITTESRTAASSLDEQRGPVDETAGCRKSFRRAAVVDNQHCATSDGNKSSSSSSDVLSSVGGSPAAKRRKVEFFQDEIPSEALPWLKDQIGTAPRLKRERPPQEDDCIDGSYRYRSRTASGSASASSSSSALLLREGAEVCNLGRGSFLTKRRRVEFSCSNTGGVPPTSGRRRSRRSFLEETRAAWGAASSSTSSGSSAAGSGDEQDYTSSQQRPAQQPEQEPDTDTTTASPGKSPGGGQDDHGNRDADEQTSTEVNSETEDDEQLEHDDDLFLSRVKGRVDQRGLEELQQSESARPAYTPAEKHHRKILMTLRQKPLESCEVEAKKTEKWVEHQEKTYIYFDGRRPSWPKMSSPSGALASTTAGRAASASSSTGEPQIAAGQHKQVFFEKYPSAFQFKHDQERKCEIFEAMVLRIVKAASLEDYHPFPSICNDWVRMCNVNAQQADGDGAVPRSSSSTSSFPTAPQAAGPHRPQHERGTTAGSRHTAQVDFLQKLVDKAERKVTSIIHTRKINLGHDDRRHVVPTSTTDDVEQDHGDDFVSIRFVGDQCSKAVRFNKNALVAELFQEAARLFENPENARENIDESVIDLLYPMDSSASASGSWSAGSGAMSSGEAAPAAQHQVFYPMRGFLQQDESESLANSGRFDNSIALHVRVMKPRSKRSRGDVEDDTTTGAVVGMPWCGKIVDGDPPGSVDFHFDEVDEEDEMDYDMEDQQGLGSASQQQHEPTSASSTEILLPGSVATAAAAPAEANSTMAAAHAQSGQGGRDSDPIITTRLPHPLLQQALNNISMAAAQSGQGGGRDDSDPIITTRLPHPLLQQALNNISNENRNRAANLNHGNGVSMFLPGSPDSSTMGAGGGDSSPPLSPRPFELVEGTYHIGPDMRLHRVQRYPPV
ncbi:unnamed protein product [Amoebophrya sp. A120]|nr:unnamed protein product [Amoebophrya sp. A120]|eukprot:GSA120T00008269001.1